MRRTTTLLLTTLACTMVAHAQASQTSGSIKGLVTNKKGEFITAGKVTARNLETGLTRTVNLDAIGYYTLPLLPVGPYRITVTSPGMKTAEVNARVSLGQNSVVNVDLEPIEAVATVEITGSAATLDTTQVNTFTAVDQKLVEAVPLNGRNFTDLVALTPGSVPDNDRISVGGARGIQNNLTIDGASYNSSFFGEQRGSTRIPYTFGADTIQELQVVTNAFDAQYNAGGAVINAVTKSGTNEFSGSALLQWRPSSMVAKIRPVPYDPRNSTNAEKARTRDFTQIIGNVNVGGPIIKDKLFFFVGIEQYHYQEDFTPGLVPSTDPLSGNYSSYYAPFMANFGKLIVGNGGLTFAEDTNRSYTSDRKNSVVFGRLDWTINENHRATLRVNSQDLKWENGTTSLTSTFAPSTGSTNQGLEKDSGLSWVAELNSVFGANLVNEARVQRAIERRPRFANSTASPEFQVNGAFTSGQNNFLPNGLDEFTWQFIDNLTWTSGDWTVKGGLDYQKFEYANTFYRYQNGAFQFGNMAVANKWASGTLLTTDSVTYLGSYSDFGGTIAFGGAQAGMYLQATYQGLLNHRLTLSGGVRYNKEQWDNNPRANPVFQGLDRAPANNNSLDPRFGFTFDIFGNNKTVLRGGYGEFTMFNPALTVSNTMNSNGNTTSTFSIRNGTAAQAFFNSGLLSYGQRVSPDGTVLTALPQDVLRNPGNYSGTGTLISAGRTGQVWDPNGKLGKKKLTSMGVEQDLGNGYIVGIRGEYAEFENLQYFVNINLGQRSAPSGTAPVITGAYYNDGYQIPYNYFSSSARPGKAMVRGRMLNFAGFGDVFLTRFDGQGDYSALILTFNRKIEQGWGFTSSLTWAKANDNNSNERTTASATSDSNVNNPANPLAVFAPSDNDRRFRGVFAGYFPIWGGIQGSAVATYTTGKPYSAISSFDINGDGGRNDYVIGTYRNEFRQPALKTFDLRFTRDFKITKKFSLEGQIDVFNALNWANQTTSQTGNNPSNALLGTFGAIDIPDRRTREVQFGIRARF